MNMRRIRAFSVIAAGVAVLTACVPVNDGRYNDPYYDPYAGESVPQDVYSDRAYRASDGRVFSTRADRDYYQARLNRGNALSARDRRRAERQRLEREADARGRADAAEAERRRLRAERRQRRQNADAQNRQDAERARRRAERDEADRQARRQANRQARRDAERAAERERRRQARQSAGNRPDTARRAPEGWTRTIHDGREVWMDTEGRIRTDF